MYVTTGSIKARGSFPEIAKLLESGFAPIVKRSPGFMGFYVVQADGKSGLGTAVFRSEKDWQAVSEQAIAWFDKNVSPLCDGESQAIAGEVVVSVEAEEAPMRTGAGAGAEARPH